MQIVIIVGVGCAGGILARELTDARLHVIGLERGSDLSSDDYTMDELKVLMRREVIWGPPEEPRITCRPSADEETQHVDYGQLAEEHSATGGQIPGAFNPSHSMLSAFSVK